MVSFKRPFVTRIWNRKIRPWLAAVASLTVLAACAYEGAIDEPVTLKFTWFSYLNGDDIRASCAPGTPSRYRFVYNGNYNEQLRSYEITGRGVDGAYYEARVQTGAGLDINRFSLTDPQSMARWKTAQASLEKSERAALDRALELSGAFGRAPAGLRLASEQFYWVASLCRDGQFYFNAWLYPSASYDGLRFPQVLLRNDGTGIAVNPPREVPAIERVRRIVPGDSQGPHFDIDVGEAGLRGHGTIF